MNTSPPNPGKTIEKRLFIVRHAHAERHRRAPDHTMPLTERGSRRAGEIGEYFADYADRHDCRTRRWLILASGAARTRQTAAGILGRMPEMAVQFHEELYRARPETIMELIYACPGNIETVIVVAHNPAVSAVARELSGDGTVFLEPGDFIGGSVNSWSEASRFLSIARDKG